MQLGSYTIRQEIARGGMGVVYRAADSAGRDVAIKVLLGGAEATPLKRRRFELEAQALARLSHPHVVRVHSIGEHAGSPYLVMDFVPGCSLGQRLESEGPLPTRESAQICHKLAGALAHCHAHSLLHRDVKPENVLWSAGEPLLTDFGLAKDLDAQSALTLTGLFMGTPGFLAPEQARGEAIGPTADVFGLGATLYALLTGEPPYSGDTLVEVLATLMSSDPTPPSELRPGVEPDLEAICMRCLRRPADERYPSAAELEADLERFLAGQPVRARERSGSAAWRWLSRRGAVVAAAAVGGALVLSVLALGLGRAPAPRDGAPTPSGPATLVDKGQLAERVALARDALRARDYFGGLKALDEVPEPPVQLVWRLNREQVRRSLHSGEFELARKCLGAPASTRALDDPSLRAAREALAREALASARTLMKPSLVAPHREVREQMFERLQVARQLLPSDSSFAQADLEVFFPIFDLIGLIASRDQNGRLTRLAVAVLDLCPDDLSVLARVAALAGRVGVLRPDDARVLIPHVRRLNALQPTQRSRSALCRVLFRTEVGLDEALRVSQELLDDSTLEVADRVALLNQRGRLYQSRKAWAQARVNLEEALELAPDSDHALVLIDLIAQMGRRSEALARCRELYESTNWGVGGQVIEPRPFRETVTRLWRLGGRDECPEVTRAAIRRLLDGIEPPDATPWWLRLAVLEFDSEEPGRAETALSFGLAMVRKSAYHDQLSRELELVRGLDDRSRGRAAGDAVNALLVRYQALAARAERRASKASEPGD